MSGAERILRALRRQPGQPCSGEELSRGEVPPWCVAVAGSRPRSFPGGEFALPAILVIRRLEEGERHDKATLNDILRDHGQAT